MFFSGSPSVAASPSPLVFAVEASTQPTTTIERSVRTAQKEENRSSASVLLKEHLCSSIPAAVDTRSLHIVWRLLCRWWLFGILLLVGYSGCCWVFHCSRGAHRLSCASSPTPPNENTVMIAANSVVQRASLACGALHSTSFWFPSLLSVEATSRVASQENERKALLSKSPMKNVKKDSGKAEELVVFPDDPDEVEEIRQIIASRKPTTTTTTTTFAPQSATANHEANTATSSADPQAKIFLVDEVAEEDEEDPNNEPISEEVNLNDHNVVLEPLSWAAARPQTDEDYIYLLPTSTPAPSSTPPPGLTDVEHHPSKRTSKMRTRYYPPALPLSSDFTPVPEMDQQFPDEMVDFGELIYLGDLTREDLLHTPLVFNVAFIQFFGIQLSAYAINGIYINDYERAALEAHQRETGVLTPLPLYPSEFLPKTTDGDDLHHYEPDEVYVPQIMDRYIVEQIGHGVFKNAFCERFLELMQIPNMPPLVVNMYNLQPGRFTRRCLYYRSEALKKAKRKFVLLVSEGDYCTTSSFTVDGEVAQEHDVTVTYLLNHPLLAHWYGVNGNVRHPKFTPVPLGFLFFHRSGRSLQSNNLDQRAFEEKKHNMYSDMFLQYLDLNKVFPHIEHQLHRGRRGCIWLEKALEIFAGGVIDAPVEWIPLNQLPQRVTTIYVVLVPIEREQRDHRPSLTNEVLIIHPRRGNRAAASAQHIALLPFTAALFHKLQQRPYGHPERQMNVVSAFSVWKPREDIYNYLVRHPEVAYFPSGKSQQDFFTLLNTFAFVASPIGYGYDCYRTWEALSFGTIPILQHPEPYMWQLPSVGLPGDLSYGKEINPLGLIDLYDDLPVVFVRNETEITLSNLHKWRKEIYEKFQRGEYKLEKLFMQHWVDMIYGHSNDEE